METITFTQSNYNDNYNAFQLSLPLDLGSLPLDLGIKIDPDDEVVFAVLLDYKFHTIIDRTKYGRNSFYMVFNYYWHSYLYIVKAVIKYFCLQQDHYEKVIESLKDFADFS